MAYVHCHSCDWAQDDFWTKRYNPVSWFFRETLRSYWKPRYIEYDKWFVEELGFEGNHLHSWYMIWRDIKRFPRRLLNQHWWTNDSWNKDPDKWVCPECGKKDLDID